ncbi:hypothetical protein PENTCL1PPCAC_29819, partial [Pristionchus entomophagus]
NRLMKPVFRSEPSESRTTRRQIGRKFVSAIKIGLGTEKLAEISHPRPEFEAPQTDFLSEALSFLVFEKKSIFDLIVDFLTYFCT